MPAPNSTGTWLIQSASARPSFFFQAEDGIRDGHVTGVQTCALPISTGLRLQQRLVDMRKEARVGDVLLLLEHSPVITLGRNARAANVLVSTEQLAKR